MPAEKIATELYGGTVVIDHWPASHRYKLQGEKDYLISVTAVTGLIDKSRPLILWAIGLCRDYLLDRIERGFVLSRDDVIAASNAHTEKKEEAAGFGSMVHDYAEAFGRAKISGEPLPEIPKDAPEQVLSGISAFLDWVDSHGVRFVQCERFLYSKVFGYCGKTDVIVEIGGKRYVVDYKTSKGLYDEFFFQVSAYWEAYEEETEEKLEGAILVHFDKDTGGFEARTVGREEHDKNLVCFLSLFNAKKRLKEMAKGRPWGD